MVIERLDEISAKIVAGPTPAIRKESTPKKFASYIKCKESSDKIMAVLHEWIDSTEKVKALVYIKAAIEAHVILRPTYEAANAEFPGRLGSKSLYYVYTGEPLAFSDIEDLETLKRAIQELRSCTSLN